MRRTFGALAATLGIAAGCSSFSGSGAPTGSTPDGGEAGVTADGATTEGGVCAGDTSCDPTNCGRAGHSCLGGRCTASACQPFQLGSFQTAPLTDLAAFNPRVVADATHVAWLRENPNGAGGGNLDVCPLAGCPNGLATSHPYPGGPRTMAGNSGSIYANFEGGANSIVVRVGPDGLPAEVVRSGQAPDTQAMHGTATGVIFIDYYDSVEASTGIYTYSEATNDTTLFAPLDHDGPSFDHRWVSLFAAIGDVFVVEPNGPPGKYGVGIARPGDSVPPAEWCATGAGSCGEGIDGSATDGTSFFWSDHTAGVVESCPIVEQGCVAAKGITSTSSFPEPAGRLFHDGTQLYVISLQNDADGMARLYTCVPGTDCSTQLKPITAAIDFYGNVWATSDAIYWIADMGVVAGEDPSDAASDHIFHVMRIAK